MPVFGLSSLDVFKRKLYVRIPMVNWSGDQRADFALCQIYGFDTVSLVSSGDTLSETVAWGSSFILRQDRPL